MMLLILMPRSLAVGVAGVAAGVVVVGCRGIHGSSSIQASQLPPPLLHACVLTVAKSIPLERPVLE